MDEETTYFDVFLKYGLYLAGIFQLICILALIFVPTCYLRKMEKEREEQENKISNHPTHKTSSVVKQKKQTDKTRKRK